MCGRFGLYLEEGIFHRFNIEDSTVEIPSGYNIAPGMTSFVVTRNSPNKGEVMKWGLIPPWAKDIRIGFKMINARAETILEKPSFRNPFKSKRCLIPLTVSTSGSVTVKTKCLTYSMTRNAPTWRLQASTR